MLALVERVYRTITRFELLPPGVRAIAAVSGGADSTAVVCLVQELAARLGIQMVGLVHVHHGLRGAAADEDERFCRALADRFRVPIVVDHADAAAEARGWRTSIEDAGRRLRLASFARAASALGASRVIVGHTRDDQAETVVMHLLRGAGPRGLGGMAARRGAIVRPVIECAHQDLVAWLGERGIPFRDDASNLDPRFLRNRVRHELLPALERVAPGARRALIRQAEIAREDADYLDRVAAEAIERLSQQGGATVSIERAALLALPPAIARRVARDALSRGAGGRFVGFEHVERLLALARGDRVGPLSLPGQRGELTADLVRLLREGRSRHAGRPVGAVLGERLHGNSSPALNSTGVPLSIPGEVLLASGARLSSELRRVEPGRAVEAALGLGDRCSAMVDAERVAALSVRSRRPGDRFRPLGLVGRKRLQDFFVDRKVPRAVRDLVPLVVDEGDRIVWVAGHGLADEYRVTGATRAVVILMVRGERA